MPGTTSFDLNDVANCAVSISDDRAMSETSSHFLTVGALAAYAAQLMEEAALAD